MRHRQFSRRGVPALAMPAALLALTAIAACTSTTTVDEAGNGSSSDDRPNVLIFLTDDQPVGTFSVMPATRRWFERGGTAFTQTFATTPQCCPSRASLLSGLYAHNHKVTNNLRAHQFDERSILPRHLQAAGYTTALVGKYLNRQGSLVDREDTSIDPPYFDRWALTLGRYNGALFNVNGELRDIDTYSTDYVTETATSWLREFEQDDDKPWFLYVAPFAPHPGQEGLSGEGTPEAVPADAYAEAPVPPAPVSPALTEGDVSDKPPYVREAGQFSIELARRLRRLQLQALMSVDDGIEEIAALIEELGEDERTLAIFLSDNGFSWGQHGADGKGTPYSESVRIPMLMRWPGHVPAGTNDDRLAAPLDLSPTILDAAGIDVPERNTMDGRSLLSDEPRRRLLLEHWGLPKDGLPKWSSIRTNRWQYVEYYAHKKVQFREYYDLVGDPWQLENLLGNGTPTDDPPVRKLARTLRRYRTCTAGECP